jgi:hypothetical protein
MKIEDIISEKQLDVESAKGRYERARQEIEDILATAKAQNRSHLTESEDQRCELAFERVDKTKADLKKAETSLERANAIKAEDDKAEERLLTTHTTSAATRRQGGRGTATISAAGLTYGAGGSYDAAEESPWMDAATGRRASLGREGRFADHEVVRDESARHAERDKILVGTHGDFRSASAFAIDGRLARSNPDCLVEFHHRSCKK